MKVITSNNLVQLIDSAVLAELGLPQEQLNQPTTSWHTGQTANQGPQGNHHGGPPPNQSIGSIPIITPVATTASATETHQQRIINIQETIRREAEAFANPGTVRRPPRMPTGKEILNPQHWAGIDISPVHRLFYAWGHASATQPDGLEEYLDAGLPLSVAITTILDTNNEPEESTTPHQQQTQQQVFSTNHHLYQNMGQQ